MMDLGGTENRRRRRKNAKRPTPPVPTVKKTQTKTPEV